MSRYSTYSTFGRGAKVRWHRELLETIYAVILAIGLMGGIWGAVYFLFGGNGLIVRIASSVLSGGQSGFSFVAVIATLVTAFAIIHWIPRMQSSLASSALLGAVVVGGYTFLFRAFSAGI